METMWELIARQRHVLHLSIAWSADFAKNLTKTVDNVSIHSHRSQKKNEQLPCRELAYPPTVWHFWVDDFPFPQVGYLSFQPRPPTPGAGSRRSICFSRQLPVTPKPEKKWPPKVANSWRFIKAHSWRWNQGDGTQPWRKFRKYHELHFNTKNFKKHEEFMDNFEPKKKLLGLLLDFFGWTWREL